MAEKKFFFVLLLGTLFLALIIFLLPSFGGKPGCLCENLEEITGDFVRGEEKAFFGGREIEAPLASSWLTGDDIRVLGETAGEERWVEVDLSEQKVRAWEGNRLFLESLVSTGKWSRTPIGTYRIWGKFKYAKMSGGSRALHTYYYLPNVPYIMYYQNGYGLHGTYWHNNFGQVMSHGCTNLPTPVAEKLFYWTSPTLPLGWNYVRATRSNPGTRIVIHE